MVLIIDFKGKIVDYRKYIRLCKRKVYFVKYYFC